MIASTSDKTNEGAAANGADEVARQARAVAPVIWLLGKVQSGKSSIVRALTGVGNADIGDGFRACTTSADIYELPPEAPLIRFLDTRGIGEAHYDPQEDLSVAERTSHCTIAVLRAMDRQQDAIFETLQRVRKRDADWPILIAQTHLHEGYASGQTHPEAYPYGTDGEPFAHASALVPDDLRRSLAWQRESFSALPGRGPLAFVPIDFTSPEDGFDPPLFGLDALHSRLAEIGPAALNAALRGATAGDDAAVGSSVHSLIVGHAAAASAADLVPVAAMAAVPVVQGRLLQVIGNRHGVTWNKRTAAQFAGALGTGFLARYAAGFGIRQLTKLIPVYGQTAGAAAAAATSFATTYALGKAADYFLAARALGTHDNAAVQKVWADALREAFDLAKVRGITEPDTGSDK